MSKLEMDLARESEKKERTQECATAKVKTGPNLIQSQLEQYLEL